MNQFKKDYFETRPVHKVLLRDKNIGVGGAYREPREQIVIYPIQAGFEPLIVKPDGKKLLQANVVNQRLTW
jgi:hypothetical protein